ncbi:hypothetical protein EVB14_04315 [Neisseria meningitidis]|nr:hypothetical protein [Neisseria meningitidis]
MEVVCPCRLKRFQTARRVFGRMRRYRLFED